FGETPREQFNGPNENSDGIQIALKPSRRWRGSPMTAESTQRPPTILDGFWDYTGITRMHSFLPHSLPHGTHHREMHFIIWIWLFGQELQRAISFHSLIFWRLLANFRANHVMNDNMACSWSITAHSRFTTEAWPIASCIRLDVRSPMAITRRKPFIAW